MNKISKLIMLCSLLAIAPVVGHSAGTYYTGGYQSPQQQVQQPTQQQAQQQRQYSTQGYSTQGYNTQGYQQPRYYAPGATGTFNYSGQEQARQQTTQQKTASTANARKQGLSLGATISRETAMWEFEMKQSGSKLSYNNISWNVVDLGAKYNMDAGNTGIEFAAGIKIGKQVGESSMIDDDISNGGYLITEWIDAGGNTIGKQIGNALSVGKSEGGSMFGFNIGVGLTDFMKLGNAKLTPSVGYRYFQTKLETKQNFGLSVDTAACFTTPGTNEQQCDPAIIIYYPDGSKQIMWRENIDDNMQLGDGASGVDTGGTYYYRQPGVSHSYEVVWAGPYIGLDLDYEINKNNAINASIELGFPGYTSTGDQPYRFDWQHPKSIEDKQGIGGAIHLGLGFNWATAVSDTIMLTVGLTYDYYTVSGVDAKTYLNSAYYNGIYNQLLQEWEDAGLSEAEMLDPEDGDQTAIDIKNLEKECAGWVCSVGNEVDSFYKSMGIRLGIKARF